MAGRPHTQNRRARQSHRLAQHYRQLAYCIGVSVINVAGRYWAGASARESAKGAGHRVADGIEMDIQRNTVAYVNTGDFIVGEPAGTCHARAANAYSAASGSDPAHFA